MRLDFTPRRYFDPLTPEQAERLAEQQKKFNDEALKTESILQSWSSLLQGNTKNLEKSTGKARDLNTSLGQGKNITKDLNKEILESGKRIEKLDFKRQLNLATLSKAAAVAANRKINAELKIEELISSQLQLLKEHVDAENKITEEKKKQNNLGDILKKTLKDTFKPFAELLTVSGIFKVVIDGALRFSKISTDIGKNLGYGADNANKVASNMIDIAQSANNVNVTFQNLADAANELSTATGYVAEYSADALETQVMLTKQFGLQAEEAAGVYKLSLLTGKSSKAVNDAMVGAFVATRNQLKVGVPFKATIAEAAKVSGQLAVNLQNNPALITKAVVQAKALGTSLEQVKNQGESLLNFESSLENELKAELLTGKQLNLERARAAALAGDQVSLAEELNKNVGTLEDFQKMNVLQQKALAEAVGLTADQLADQLRKQKLAQESGKSLAQITKEEALAAEQRQATQDKFNQAILKLQDFFGNLVAGPLGTFLEILTNALPLVKGIGIALGAIYVTSKAITIAQAITTALKTEEAIATGTTNLLLGARTSIMSSQLGILVAQAAAAVIANPLLGIVGLAAAAGVGALIYSQMNDGIIGPGGETIVSGPEGSIQLNKNDSLVAGTNLFGGGGMSGGSIDLTPMINAINEVKAAVKDLVNRPVNVNIDGKQVGSSMVQSSYKVA
jgi:hypothetical protein